MDFATLTGACIVALGTNVAGIVSNNTKLATKVKSSSAKTSEEVWAVSYTHLTLPTNREV